MGASQGVLAPPVAEPDGAVGPHLLRHLQGPVDPPLGGAVEGVVHQPPGHGLVGPGGVEVHHAVVAHVRGGDLDVLLPVENGPEGGHPVGGGVDPQKLEPLGGGRLPGLRRHLDHGGLALRGAQEEVEGDGAQQLRGQVAAHLLPPAAGQGDVVVVQGPLAPGHGGHEAVLVHGDPGLPGDEGPHVPELPRHIVHRPVRLLVGHVDVEVGHVEELRQVPEGQSVGVAGQGGVEDEPGLGHEARPGGPDEDLVVGAQGGGNPLLLGGAEEALLGHGAGQVAGKGLAGVGLEPLGQEQFTGGEEADHDVLLRVGQAVGHGPVDLLEDHLVRPGDPLPAIGQAVFHPVGPPARQDQGFGLFRVGGGKLGDLPAEGFDEVHRWVPLFS